MKKLRNVKTNARKISVSQGFKNEYSIIKKKRVNVIRRSERLAVKAYLGLSWMEKTKFNNIIK